MSRQRGLWAAVAVCAVIAGLVVVMFARRDGGPPSPAPDATSRSSQAKTPTSAKPLARSVPTRIRIPAIAVDAPVLALGLKADGTVQEPSLSQPDLTSWFKEGAAPGEIGPAAFYGHVDTRRTGPAVFYRLGELQPDDLIKVSRQDGSVVTFSVDSVEQIPKTQFPTQRVYGAVPEPVIRLMTCGGEFDAAKGSYRDNIIVYGTLTGPSN